MSEHDEQVTFFDFVDRKQLRDKYVIAAVPNQRKTNAITGRRFKREGVLAGYPDVLVDVPARGFAGLRIEFKFGRNKLSEDQIRVSKLLSGNHYRFIAVWSASEAIAELCWYLNLPEQSQFKRKS